MKHILPAVLSASCLLSMGYVNTYAKATKALKQRSQLFVIRPKKTK